MENFKKTIKLAFIGAMSYGDVIDIPTFSFAGSNAIEKLEKEDVEVGVAIFGKGMSILTKTRDIAAKYKMFGRTNSDSIETAKKDVNSLCKEFLNV